MTDKPILFSGPMVNAILEDRKTQTRRVLKVPKWTNRSPEEFLRDGNSGFWKTISTKTGAFKDLPTYQVGDRLYVREAWRSLNGLDHLSPSAMGAAAIEAGYKTPWGPVKYIADGSFLDWDDWHRCDPSFGTKEGKFRQGMHMPRWASRLTLVVTDVRVQRLQEISDDDAQAEGIEPYAGIDPDCSGYLNYSNQSEDGWWLSPKNSFRTLWNSINDARGFGWDANPWVVAVTFETRHYNIDQMEVSA